MNTVVIYPGRFQPFHLGHKATYDALCRQYGEGNVYIATSNVQAPLTSPFNYSDKVEMMTRLGIPAGRIVQTKNPYQAQEITGNLNPDDTVLIFAVSEKDMQGSEARFKFGTKKDGTPSYMQPLKDSKKLEPMSQHAYVTVAPVVNFKVQGQDADSATAIRKLYVNGNPADRAQIITDLYGAADPALQATFDKKLLAGEKVNELVYQAKKNSQGMLPEQRARLAKILESISAAEKIANQVVLLENYINPDYLDERR